MTRPLLFITSLITACLGAGLVAQAPQPAPAIAAALKAGARLAIVDFTPPPGSEATRPADRGNDGMHGISPELLLRELRDAGFEPVSSGASGRRGFMVVVVKAEK